MDLGTSRTLTRLHFVPRNTVYRGQRGPSLFRICPHFSLLQRDVACPHVVRVVFLS